MEDKEAKASRVKAQMEQHRYYLWAYYSIISMSEVVRITRFINILFALWLIVALWIYKTPETYVMLIQIGAALLLILFSVRKGIVKDKHGGYNKYIH